MTFIERFEVRPGPGVRVAVKDLVDMAGVVTTCGSKVIAATASPAMTDAACLAGTRAAEAAGEVTIVGKTNLHELAFGVTGINPWFGTPANPFDPELVPGGSSSGSAVAVATGAADIAFGSDTGGSIRIPSACCGTVGLKTTRGRVGLDGVALLAPSLDTVGPMAATLDATIAGMTLLEPGFSLLHARPARRIGRVRLPAEPWIDAELDAALASLTRGHGIELVETELPLWEAATHATMTILSAEAWEMNGELWRDHGDEISPDVAQRLELASWLTPDSVAEAWEAGRDWSAGLDRLFGDVDLLALPVLAATPPTLAEAARMTEIRYAAPFNLAGVPALAVPVASGRLAGGDAPGGDLPGGDLPGGDLAGGDLAGGDLAGRRSAGGPGPDVPPASLQLVGPLGSEEVLLATALMLV